MRSFDAEEVAAETPWVELVDAIAEALRSDTAQSPDRHVHSLDPLGPQDQGGSFLLMPSWDDDLVAVKAVTYLPSNAGTEVPTVNGAVLLFDRAHGRHVATMDGDALTARRTTAIGALAGRHLIRPDAGRLLVVGTGQLAPNVVRSHAALRSLDRVLVWGRNPHRADRVVADLAAEGIVAEVADDLDAAVAESDIISTVTGATSPLIKGALLAPGSHLELYGSFAPGMRESDDDAMRRGSIFVDTVAGASLSGDLAQPLEAGVLSRSDVLGDLAGLVRNRHVGRVDDAEITVFKSAGFALADLAAARLIWRRAR